MSSSLSLSSRVAVKMVMNSTSSFNRFQLQMAKREYKLEDFVAYSANVNCLKIGKKTWRNFITGGDDEKLNLWSSGKPTTTTSLNGHTSPIESVAFDSTEVLVAAGASSGVIKLWDLEETKVVRTLSGHRSYCTALEFHPFEYTRIKCKAWRAEQGCRPSVHQSR